MGTMDGNRPKRLNYEAPVGPVTRLSKPEIEKIREQARLKVELELKDREADSLLKQFMEEERRAADPVHGVEPIFLELAPSMPYIMLDGVQYLSGVLYYVTPAVFAVLSEQQARGWAHEEITQVRSENGAAPRRPAHVGTANFAGHRRPRDLVVSGAALAGASPASLLGIGA